MFPRIAFFVSFLLLSGCQITVHLPPSQPPHCQAPPCSTKPPTTPPTTPPTEPLCSRLSWEECHKAQPRCLVVVGQERGSYACREPQNACEKQGFDTCSNDPRCTYLPGSCYCSPGDVCICGGGPPSLCAETASLCKTEKDCGILCLGYFQCCAPGTFCLDLYPSCDSLPPASNIPTVCRQGLPKDACQADTDCPQGYICQTTPTRKECILRPVEPPCSRLSWEECHKAQPRCLVVRGDTPHTYACREPQNACEKQGFDTCSNDPQCFYLPGVCYCPPDVMCACGGGPPPLCADTRSLCKSHEDCGQLCQAYFRCCSPNSSCDDIFPSCSPQDSRLPRVCHQGYQAP